MKRKLDAEKKLNLALKNGPVACKAEWYDVVSSTNDLLKESAQNGAPEGSIILSDMQTKGRGRTGRLFYSPKDIGLYMSILLRPHQKMFEPGLITACAAVSVQRAILKLYSLSVKIKWVNDLYADGKKLCGILAEGHFNQSGNPDYIVLGIGINLAPPEDGYAPEIAGICTSLSELTENREVVLSKSELCTEIVKEFFHFYTHLSDLSFLDIYKKESCVLGNEVTYVQNGITKTAFAIDIDERARLVLETKNEGIIALSSGEITHIRPKTYNE